MAPLKSDDGYLLWIRRLDAVMVGRTFGGENFDPLQAEREGSRRTSRTFTTRSLGRLGSLGMTPPCGHRDIGHKEGPLETAAPTPGVVFETGNRGTLPVPRVIGCLMVVVFGVPALMLVATTWREVPKYPWLIAVYLASLFPFLVLFVVSRLMARYALRVHADGGVDVVLPFKTVRIAKADLAAITLTSTYVAATNARRSWVVLSSPDGATWTTFSPSAFDAKAFEQFLAAVREVNPNVKIGNAP